MSYEQRLIAKLAEFLDSTEVGGRRICDPVEHAIQVMTDQKRTIENYRGQEDGASKYEALGKLLSDYFPGAHVKMEHVIDTAMRVMMGQRRALARLGKGWSTPPREEVGKIRRCPCVGDFVFAANGLGWTRVKVVDTFTGRTDLQFKDSLGRIHDVGSELVTWRWP